MYDGIHGKNQISLCMIVKNEEACIHRAISSVKDLVHEIIVVDTGSTDKTKEIAASLGAKLFDIPWRDNFSEARNFSMKQAKKEWILILDADEALSKRDFPQIEEVTKGNEYEGAFFYQRNYFEDPSAENWCVNKTDYEEAKGFSGYSDVLALRLFKNLENIFYEGIVHESVDESLKGRKIRYFDIPIHHFRQDSFKTQSPEKKEKYLRLLQKEYEINPFSVKTCFLLGRQFYELDKFPEAIAYLEQAVSMGTKSEIVYENLAASYYQCGMHAETIKALEKVIEFNPRYAEASATIALSYYEVGQYDKAINSLVRAINLKPTSIRYYYNLAAIFYRERDLEASESYLREAIKLSPKFTRSFYLLFYVLMEQERFEEVREVGNILKQMDPALYENVREKHEALAKTPNSNTTSSPS